MSDFLSSSSQDSQCASCLDVIVLDLWSQEGKCTITVEVDMLDNMSNSMVRIQSIVHSKNLLIYDTLILGLQMHQHLQCATPGCKKQKRPNPNGGYFDYCSIYCQENGLTSAGMCHGMIIILL